MNFSVKGYKIPENRLKHCYGVGWVMYKVAKDYYKWNENKCREMFILGLLHDAGYEFVGHNDSSILHSKILSKLLNHNNYCYDKEIKYHDMFTKKYKSKELELLWLADMVVDGQGNIVGFEGRIKDIKKRHGKNSKVAKDSEKLIRYLEKIFH